MRTTNALAFGNHAEKAVARLASVLLLRLRLSASHCSLVRRRRRRPKRAAAAVVAITNTHAFAYLSRGAIASPLGRAAHTAQFAMVKREQTADAVAGVVAVALNNAGAAELLRRR